MLEHLSEFHFIRPWWLLVLLSIPLVIWLHSKLKSVSNSWSRVLSNDLYNALIESPTGRSKVGSYWIPVLVVVIAAFSLAGPTYERLPQPVEVKQDPLVIVLDLSLSMDSDDVKPSRIERAKFKITDILRRRDEGLTGLVAYAGDAYVVTPLTIDSETILNLLNSLSPEIMPIKGSNVVLGIRRANELLINEEVGKGRLLLVTDGFDDFSSLQDEVNRRFSISILGMGTASGVDSMQPIPDFDENKLRDFAQVSGGRYSTVTLDDRDITHLLSSDLFASTERLEGQLFDLWHDLGYYLIIPLILLFALLTRKGGLLVVMLIFIVPQAKADWLEDMWVPEERQAVKEYRSGNFETAREMFEQQTTLESSYNRGNALAMTGQIQEAIEAYENVLAANPDHEDAAYNRQLLKDFLEQQQSEQNQQGSGEDQQQTERDGEENGQKQSNPSDSDATEQENQSQQAQNEPDQSDPEQSTEQTSDSQQSQDQQQASQSEQQEQTDARQQDQTESEPTESPVNESQMAERESMDERELREIHERWLRRIPNDPGGLLQRKFEAESNARIERGDLDRRDAGSAW